MAVVPAGSHERPPRRTLEPEVMDSADEARDYDAMDHAEVNARFCEDLLALPPPSAARTRRGHRQLPSSAIELWPANARSHRRGHPDLARHMVARATRNVERAGAGEAASA